LDVGFDAAARGFDSSLLVEETEERAASVLSRAFFFLAVSLVQADPNITRKTLTTAIQRILISSPPTHAIIDRRIVRFITTCC
jgi:hypothetical protein